MEDLSFVIRRVDAFHIRMEGLSYWEDYRPGGGERGRFYFKSGWRTVYASVVESPLVRVELDDGTVGWGEATAPICPELVVLCLSRLVAPLVINRPFQHATACWDWLYDANRGRGHHSGTYLEAMAALDVAVWDALARRAGKPLASLLSEAAREVVPVYLSGIRRATRNERRETLNTWLDQGLRGAKIFVDDDTQATLAEVEYLLEGAPELESLMVDALWMYPTLEAAAAAKTALDFDRVSWLECPLLPEDVEGHRAIRPLPGVPIAVGETFFTQYQLGPWLSPTPALDIFQPDICRTGVSDGIRQARLAQAAGLTTTPHMGSGSPIVQSVALSFAAAFTDILCEYQAGLADRAQPAFDSAWAFADGGCRVPDRPGHGVVVDTDALGPFIAPHPKFDIRQH